MPDRTRTIVLIALAAAMTSAGAHLRLPVGPVPITLQTFFVLLSGAVLGPRAAAAAMALYVAAGLVGLPVFTAPGGPHYILSPTFGFILSFIPAAVVSGWVFGRFTRPSRGAALAAMAAGTVVVYAVGLPWLAANLRFVQHKEVGTGALLAMGMLPFLPGDLVKIAMGAWIAPILTKALSLTPRR